jgi:hypothetical protein
MAKRPKPVEPAGPEVKRKGPRRVSSGGAQPPSFADLEKAHKRETAEEQSAKRANPEHGPSVAGGTRAGRPRSGRSGSDSNASRRSRGH